MSPTSVTARSSSSPKKLYNSGGYTTSPWQRGPTQHYNKRQFSKKVAKSGKLVIDHQSHRERQNHDDYPRQFPSSGTLLERIGGSVEDIDEGSNTRSGRRVEEEGADMYSDLSFHFYTPEPEEVERFLESVIPVAQSPSGSVHARSGNKPSLALETYNLSLDHHLVKMEDTTSSSPYSPTQTAVNSTLSANHDQKILGDAMPSESTIEECKKHLAPVLAAAAARARGSERHLDLEKCHSLLSDDHCTHFLQKAKEMRHQLSSLLSEKTPINQGWGGSLKRDRVDEVDAWVRNTRSRFNSVNTVVSDVSKRDSDITLVDVWRLVPKAPRAMLQVSKLNMASDSAQDGAPSLVASPTTAMPFIESVRQVPETLATPRFTAEIDTTMTSEQPVQTTSMSSDFVTHLPTQAGVWFKHQGRRFTEIVDVAIEVSDDMFYLSCERYVALPTSTVHAASSITSLPPHSQPFRMRMDVRLCSVPVGASADGGDAALHVCQWPKKGKLVVQLNPDSERSKTWLPHALTSDPLDVTSCMRPGKNIVRFIQLSDLSDFTFVLVASPLPPEQEWRGWDWAAPVNAPATSSSSTTEDPMDSLSEFAHIPITIRS